MASKQFVDKGKQSVSARESQRRAAAETTHPLLRLQGLIGNQALLRMIQATATGGLSSATPSNHLHHKEAERGASRSGPITDMEIKRGPETMDNKSGMFGTLSFSRSSFLCARCV
ncbi:MAG: hypothetical protein K6U80_11695 [Firmicutes bacterium]|nr:hypothetical protein [Bacillota bacterium]